MHNANQHDGWQIVIQHKHCAMPEVYSYTDNYATHVQRQDTMPRDRITGYKLLARDKATGKWHSYYSFGLIGA